MSRNLGGDAAVRSLFDDMSVFDEPVAAASVGQVYRATMNGREVAVKVQRPDVREQVTLDLFVVRQIASIGRDKKQLKVSERDSARAGSLVPIERYARQPVTKEFFHES